MYNHQLDAFIKVAELGSFRKAAEAMYISSPAILQQINLLEEACGFRLFFRSSRGVSLTPAGRCFYEDAKNIIHLFDEALQRAGKLANDSEYTVRVGTSLLYKCRLLPDIWAKACGDYPNLKIEILPMTEYRSREDQFSLLGRKYDLWEGIYASSWGGRCRFLELAKTPFCCAVAKNHRLASNQKLTMADLNGEYLVMPVAGVSKELDAFRREVQERYPTVQIVDSTYYGVDTFTLCEVNPYVLITQQVYADIHPNLVTIPLETGYAMPYGLIYPEEPSEATKLFIAAAEEYRQKEGLSSI